MNRLDWAQIALSLGVMLIGFYIALFRHPGRGVQATTRVASFGVALLGLSYLAGGFEGSAVEGPLLDRVEAYSALVGILVVLGGIGLAGAWPGMMRPEDLGQCRGTQRGSVGTDGDRACARPEGVAFDVSLAAITPRGVKDLRRSSRGVSRSEY